MVQHYRFLLQYSRHHNYSELPEFSTRCLHFSASTSLLSGHHLTSHVVRYQTHKLVVPSDQALLPLTYPTFPFSCDRIAGSKNDLWYSRVYVNNDVFAYMPTQEDLILGDNGINNVLSFILSYFEDSCTYWCNI